MSSISREETSRARKMKKAGRFVDRLVLLKVWQAVLEENRQMDRWAGRQPCHPCEVMQSRNQHFV